MEKSADNYKTQSKLFPYYFLSEAEESPVKEDFVTSNTALSDSANSQEIIAIHWDR